MLAQVTCTTYFSPSEKQQLRRAFLMLLTPIACCTTVVYIEAVELPWSAKDRHRSRSSDHQVVFNYLHRNDQPQGCWQCFFLSMVEPLMHVAR